MIDNLFANLPSTLDQEQFDTLYEKEGVRIERILSFGQSSPVGYWYDQSEDEWVMLLEGEAVIGYEDGSEVRLVIGDHLLIPAHTKHRVAFTAEDRLTIWLAVFAA